MNKTTYASVLFPFPIKTRITARIHRSKTETQRFILNQGVSSCLVCTYDFTTYIARGQPCVRRIGAKL